MVTDEQPPVKSGYALDHRAYRRCGQYNGIPPEGPTTMKCKEGAIGRFLYVYLPKNDHLHICEAEAYGTRKLTQSNWVSFSTRDIFF